MKAKTGLQTELTPQALKQVVLLWLGMILVSGNKIHQSKNLAFGFAPRV